MHTSTTEIYTLSLHDALPICLDAKGEERPVRGLHRVSLLGSVVRRHRIEWPKSLQLQAVEMTNRQRSEEHTSELQSHSDLVCRLLLEKKNSIINLFYILGNKQ